ncbi:MAG: CHAT domain-containing protein [Myxococcota bacterium]
MTQSSRQSYRLLRRLACGLRRRARGRIHPDARRSARLCRPRRCDRRRPLAGGSASSSSCSRPARPRRRRARGARPLGHGGAGRGAQRDRGLWRVHDEATAQFMATFYQTLARSPDARAPEAVRAAQRMLLADPYRHPYFWSPFLLISSWL